MLAKYPQITKLYGFDARTKYWVLLSVGLQIFTAFLAAKFDWAWSTIAVLAWIWCVHVLVTPFPLIRLVL